MVDSRSSCRYLTGLALSVSLLGCQYIVGISDVEFSDDASAGIDSRPGTLGDGPVADDATAPADAIPVPADWWDTAYRHRTQLTVNVPSLQASMRDVPVLLITNAVRMPCIDDTEAAGLRVIDTEGNLLEHEVEHWAPGRASYLWIRIPTMEDATQIPLWLYYGGPSDGPQPDPTSVWNANYLAVWHLQENVMNGSEEGIHADASGNGNNGIQHRNGPAGDEWGAIGVAQDFDGNNDYIAVTLGNGLRDPHREMTIVARAFLRDNNNAFPHIVSAGGPTDAGRYRQLFWQRDNRGWAGHYLTDGDSPILASFTGDYNLWVNIGLVYDGSEVRMYLNGTQVDQAETTGTVQAVDTFFIGGSPNLDQGGNTRREFNGYIDELRISSEARSDDWLAVQNASLNDALITTGTTESLTVCTQ